MHHLRPEIYLQLSLLSLTSAPQIVSLAARDSLTPHRRSTEGNSHTCSRCRRDEEAPGLTNLAHFAEIRRIRAGRNSKIVKFTVYCFKISEKDKNQQKYLKQTRSNSKVTGEEIFVKPGRLDW
jgi:hypothetical protein